MLASVAGYTNADSDGIKTYALWKYSPTEDILYRRSWSVTELSSSGLPAVQQDPTADEWAQFLAQNLKPEAYHLTQFSFQSPPDQGLRVEYDIKNPKRTGKVDHYLLELNNL